MRRAVLALLLAGCIDFRKDLEEFCVRNPSRCALTDGGTGGGSGGGAGGAMGGGSGGGGGVGGGSAGDAGLDAGTDAGAPVCRREQCRLADYRLPHLVWTVSGSAPDDVWLGGRFGLARYDGVALAARGDNPAPVNTIFGLTALARDHVWVAGTFSPDVFFFNGMDWRSKKFDGGDSAYSLYARGVDEVFLAAGESLYRYDGGAWERFFENTAAFGTFYDVHGQPGLPVYAVADENAFRVDSSLNVTVESPPVGSESLYAVNVSPTGQVWAVGSGGLVVRRGIDGGWEAMTVDVPGNMNDLYGVWVRSDDDVWIAGELGTILHWRADAGWTARGAEAFDGSVNLNQVHWQDAWGQGNHLWVAGTIGVNFAANFDGGVAAHFLLP